MYYFANSIVDLFLNASINFDVSLFIGFSATESLAFLSICFFLACAFGCGAILCRFDRDFAGNQLHKNLFCQVIAMALCILCIKVSNVNFGMYNIALWIFCCIVIFISSISGVSKLTSPFTAVVLLWILVCSVFTAWLGSSIVNSKTSKTLGSFANVILPKRDLSIEQKLVAALSVSKDVKLDSAFIELADSAISKCFASNSNFVETNTRFIDNLQPLLIDSLKQISEQSPFSENLVYVPTNINGMRYIYFFKTSSASTAALMLYDMRTENLKDNLSTIFHQPEQNFKLVLNNFDIATYHQSRLTFQNSASLFPYKLFTTRKDTVFSTETSTYYVYCNYSDKFGVSDYVVFSPKTNMDRVFLSLFTYLFIFIFATVIFFFVGSYSVGSNFSYKNVIRKLKPDLKFRFSVAIFIAELIGFSLILFVTSQNFKQRQQKERAQNIFEQMNVVGQHLTAASYVSVAYCDSLSKAQNFPFQLYDSSGRIAYSSFTKLISNQLFKPYWHPQYGAVHQKGNSNYYLQQESLDGAQYTSSYMQLYNKGKAYVLHFPDLNFNIDNDFALANFYANSTSIYVAVFILTLMLSYIIAQYLFAKLKVLGDEMHAFKLSLSEEPRHIEWRNDDEIGALVSKYNVMVDDVQAKASIIVSQQKDLAWREMAKQVAHEIKNPITPIKLNLQRLLMQIENGHPDITSKTKQACISILQQIEQLSKIAGTFSEYANLPALEPESFDVIELVNDVVALNSHHGDNISLSINTESDSLILFQDKIQLQRVLNNLISNAVHAIEPDKQGSIIVVIKSIENMVHIAIADNGIGIDEDKRDQIFKPYFTTKTSGTGLGLAMCKDISQRMGGDLSFESIAGQGSTFSLRILKESV
jgi:two-component system, NtrC family, nitrogen regulation sensor histidine kinase NtrY